MGDIDALKKELTLLSERVRRAAHDPEAVKRLSREIMEVLK